MEENKGCLYWFQVLLIFGVLYGISAWIMTGSPWVFIVPFVLLLATLIPEIYRWIEEKREEKACEKRHREAKEREETQHIEAEKAAIIAMIEKATKGKGGDQS